ncbi:hypothetical protein [Victivallis sp. Marseille-Q1083]|uniref:hypothetical protein n=1 Tax=Victivallis sp. Marseille-Q1083 TaxID=2717288 RepID=UPI001589E4D6|nr:hypothetical protein [Victivallis sp. Marseille-Q1083]
MPATIESRAAALFRPVPPEADCRPDRLVGTIVLTGGGCPRRRKRSAFGMKEGCRLIYS